MTMPPWCGLWSPCGTALPEGGAAATAAAALTESRAGVAAAGRLQDSTATAAAAATAQRNRDDGDNGDGEDGGNGLTTEQRSNGGSTEMQVRRASRSDAAQSDRSEKRAP